MRKQNKLHVDRLLDAETPYARDFRACFPHPDSPDTLKGPVKALTLREAMRELRVFTITNIQEFKDGAWQWVV